MAVGLALVAAAYALAFAGALAVAPWGLALGSTAILAAILWLGARRRGRTPRAFGVVILVVSLSTALGAAVALLAAPPRADGPLLLGLPLVTAVLLLLVGAVPLVVLPLAYALRFDRDVMPRDELKAND
jgi:peptidoglycan biosynthesis protein MviN/MurJ (putative lipid II flippase)